MTLFDGEPGTAMQPRPAPSTVGVIELDHATIRDLMSDYLDGSIHDADRARVDEHLQKCPRCRAYFATLRAATQAVRDLPHQKAPESLRQRLRQIPQA